MSVLPPEKEQTDYRFLARHVGGECLGLTERRQKAGAAGERNGAGARCGFQK